MKPSIDPAKEKHAMDVRDQIAAFLAQGGKIQHLPHGHSAESKQTFTISKNKPDFDAGE